MSGGHFHVHGPLDHEVEHARHSRDPFAGRIAVMTAIFATIGALFGYMGGATQNEALMHKNDAAIRKTEASDQWNFYQAKSGKQNLAELGAAPAPCAAAPVSGIIDPSAACPARIHPAPGWRNWYTQQTQNLPAARP